MNIHKRCLQQIPNLCGSDHTERRGRIHVVAKVDNGGREMEVKSKSTNFKFITEILIFNHYEDMTQKSQSNSEN